jgi:hypothetical protein
MLFVGTSTVPSITGYVRQLHESSLQENNEISTMRLSASSLVVNHDFTAVNPAVKSSMVSAEKLADDVGIKAEGGRSSLMLSDASISQPLNNDIFRAGDIVDIEGTANGSLFQYYIIEWGIGENPSVWSSTGITLVNDGQIGIVNDTLASWDTSFITNGGFYTVRLTVQFSDHQSQAFVKNIYVDPSLKQGWPQRINYEYNSQGGYYYWAGFLEPVVDDLDHDGHSEIIVYKGGFPPKVDVFRDNGSLLWSSPVGTTDVSGGNLHIPLVDDINHDGFDEIIVFRFISSQSSSQIYVFNHDGTVLSGWPIVIAKEYHPTMLIADVNVDGYDEIVFKGNDALDRKMIIIDHTGSILAEWSVPVKHWGGSVEASPAVGNFDDDPQLEIVCAEPSENAGYNSSSGQWNDEGVIHVYNLDGSEVAGWPQYTAGVIFSSPAVGDINHDGYPEVVVGLEFADPAPDSRYGGVYVFDRNGNVLPGWPFEKGWNFASSPSLADFDHDGDLEIVISQLGYQTYVIHHNGTLASGWPRQTDWNDYYSTVIGDINNDNIPDIVTTAGDGFYPSIYEHGGVYAWNYNGTPIPGFPKVTEVDAQAPATIADIDHDGKVEILASSDWDYDFQTSHDKFRGTLYVWEVAGAVNQSTMVWPTFHHDLQRTGLYSQAAGPLLAIGNITGGLFKVKTTIKNNGNVPANNIQWNITTVGGVILLGKKTTGSIAVLNASDKQAVASKPLFGFGKTVIRIVASAPGTSAVKEQNATVWLFFIHMK